MIATGVNRKLDELGRIVVPKELRNSLGIAKKVPLEIFYDKESIILKKYEPRCIFCGKIENLEQFHGQKVCLSYQNELKNLT